MTMLNMAINFKHSQHLIRYISKVSSTRIFICMALTTLALPRVLLYLNDRDENCGAIMQARWPFRYVIGARFVRACVVSRREETRRESCAAFECRKRVSLASPYYGSVSLDNNIALNDKYVLNNRFLFNVNLTFEIQPNLRD